MIEVTFVQAVSTLVGIFSLGVGVGYKIAPKTRASVDGYCSTPVQYGKKSIKFKKELINGKCKDITCYFLQGKNICSLTEKKCKHLT